MADDKLKDQLDARWLEPLLTGIDAGAVIFEAVSPEQGNLLCRYASPDAAKFAGNTPEEHGWASNRGSCIRPWTAMLSITCDAWRPRGRRMSWSSATVTTASRMAGIG